MLAHNRRKLPPLHRVVAYIGDSEYAWLQSAAAAQGWTVSRYVAWAIMEAHDAERQLVREMSEDRLVGEGRL